MKIRDTIAAINQMQVDGVIDRYAIGGAVGATFYLEPVATLDVEVFVTFRPEPGKLVASSQPLFDYLSATVSECPMTFDFSKIQQSKRQLRERLAELPIVEKLALLDQLRERALALRSPHARPQAAVLHEPNGPYTLPGKSGD